MPGHGSAHYRLRRLPRSREADLAYLRALREAVAAAGNDRDRGTGGRARRPFGRLGPRRMTLPRMLAANAEAQLAELRP